MRRNRPVTFRRGFFLRSASRRSWSACCCISAKHFVHLSASWLIQDFFSSFGLSSSLFLSFCFLARVGFVSTKTRPAFSASSRSLM